MHDRFWPTNQYEAHLRYSSRSQEYCEAETLALHDPDTRCIDRYRLPLFPTVSSRPRRMAAATARGSCAWQIAWLTATRRAPAATAVAIVSRLTPPRMNAGSEVSAVASRMNSSPASSSKCFVMEANAGPTPT